MRFWERNRYSFADYGLFGDDFDLLLYGACCKKGSLIVGIKPYMEEQITYQEAFELGTKPFKDFMVRNTREKDLALFFVFVILKIQVISMISPYYSRSCFYD